MDIKQPQCLICKRYIPVNTTCDYCNTVRQGEPIKTSLGIDVLQLMTINRDRLAQPTYFCSSISYGRI